MRIDEVKADPTINVVLKLPILADSKLFELIQASSRIGLQAKHLQRYNKPIPVGLKAIYEEAQAKLKAALKEAFPIAQFEIDNLEWDTDHYLSYHDHCVILAPEG